MGFKPITDTSDLLKDYGKTGEDVQPLRGPTTGEKILGAVEPLTAAASGYASGASLGIIPKLIEKLSPQTSQYLKSVEHAYPMPTEAANLASYFNPKAALSAPTAIYKGVGALTEKLAAKAAPKMIRKVAGNVTELMPGKVYQATQKIPEILREMFGGATKGAITGGITEGSKAAVEGKSPEEIGQAAKTGAEMYGGAGGAGPVVTKGLQKAGTKMMSTYLLPEKAALQKSEEKVLKGGTGTVEDIMSNAKGMSASNMLKNVRNKIDEVDDQIKEIVKKSDAKFNLKEAINNVRNKIKESKISDIGTPYSGAEDEALGRLDALSKELAQKGASKESSFSNALNLKRQLYRRSQDLLEKMAKGETVEPGSHIKQAVEKDVALEIKNAMTKSGPLKSQQMLKQAAEWAPKGGKAQVAAPETDKAYVDLLNEDWSKLIDMEDVLLNAKYRVEKRLPISPMGVFTGLGAGSLGGLLGMPHSAAGAIGTTALIEMLRRPPGAKLMYNLPKAITPYGVGAAATESSDFVNPDAIKRKLNEEK